MKYYLIEVADDFKPGGKNRFRAFDTTKMKLLHEVTMTNTIIDKNGSPVKFYSVVEKE